MKCRSNSSNKAKKQWLKLKLVQRLNYSSLEKGFDLSLQRLSYRSTEKNLKMAKLKNPNVFENKCFQKSQQT